MALNEPVCCNCGEFLPAPGARCPFCETYPPLEFTHSKIAMPLNALPKLTEEEAGELTRRIDEVMKRHLERGIVHGDPPRSLMPSWRVIRFECLDCGKSNESALCDCRRDRLFFSPGFSYRFGMRSPYTTPANDFVSGAAYSMGMSLIDDMIAQTRKKTRMGQAIHNYIDQYKKWNGI